MLTTELSLSEWGRWIQSFRVYTRTDPIERLLAQAERQPDGCLLYLGKSLKNGYPWISAGHQGGDYGHRLAYERAYGPIPADHPRLHHKCREPRCIEPTHLLPVSARSHAREHGLGEGPCRSCGSDDWYTRRDNGGRQCRECRRRRRAAC